MLTSAVQQGDSVLHIYTCPRSFSYSFPLWSSTGYWIQGPVRYSRALLSHRPASNSLHLLPTNSQPMPLPTRQADLCPWFCFDSIDGLFCVINMSPHVSGTLGCLPFWLTSLSVIVSGWSLLLEMALFRSFSRPSGAPLCTWATSSVSTPLLTGT